MRDPPHLGDFGDAVYAAYGRAMPEAQDFEYTLGIYAFTHRVLADEALVADPEAWLERMRSGHEDEHSQYGRKLVRMTAGQRARTLELPAMIADDLTEIISERNFLAHRWFNAQRLNDQQPDAAIAELEGLATTFNRRGFAVLHLLGVLMRGAGKLGVDEAERVWQEHALSNELDDDAR